MYEQWYSTWSLIIQVLFSYNRKRVKRHTERRQQTLESILLGWQPQRAVHRRLVPRELPRDLPSLSQHDTYKPKRERTRATDQGEKRAMAFWASKATRPQEMQEWVVTSLGERTWQRQGRAEEPPTAWSSWPSAPWSRSETWSVSLPKFVRLGRRRRRPTTNKDGQDGRRRLLSSSHKRTRSPTVATEGCLRRRAASSRSWKTSAGRCLR